MPPTLRPASQFVCYSTVSNACHRYRWRYCSRTRQSWQTDSHSGRPRLHHYSPRRHASSSSKDTWSSTQYLKHIAPRTRPSQHLVTSLPFSAANPPKRIVDLGCGPGNSTKVLRDRFPQSQIWGVDSSESMIETARKDFKSANNNSSSSSEPATSEHSAEATVTFEVGDIRTWTPPPTNATGATGPPIDLYFANAVLHWFPPEERIKLIKRLLSQPDPENNHQSISRSSTAPVFAFQLPANLSEPSHHLMRAVAASPGPWRPFLEAHTPSEVMYPVQSPEEFYDSLIPFCDNVEIWSTTYQHVMDDHDGIVEWVMGTGLRPFLEPFKDEVHREVREAFLNEYLARLKGEEGYEVRADGKVLLRYPRVFGVAVGKS